MTVLKDSFGNPVPEPPVIEPAPLSPPTTTDVTLCINDTCNLACTYCFPHVDKTGQVMSKQMADDIRDYCIKEGIVSVGIPTVEPLASPEILKYIITSYHDNGINVHSITTNLYGLTDEIIELLKQFNIFVLISFDGLWQDEYRITKTGMPTSHIVKRNIEAIKEAGIEFNIASTVVHNTAHRIYDNYQFLKQLTDSIAFNFDYESGYKIRMGDVPVIKSKFKQLAKEGIYPFPVNKIRKKIKDGTTFTTNFMCGAGRGSYTIAYDGYIYPCFHVGGWQRIGISLGSIHTGINKETKRMFEDYNTSTVEACKRCKPALCGLCYVMSHFLYGDMCRPVPAQCKILKALEEVIRECG